MIVDMDRVILHLFSGHRIRERICRDYGLDDSGSTAEGGSFF